MDRRRCLLNEYEEVVDELLNEATHQYDARVHCKVRIADALAIEHSGLTAEEYSYALRAHFDFVVSSRGDRVAFAIEFDGPRHTRDPNTIHRDSLKNTVCTKLGMPLLRVDARFFKRVEQFSILGWLIELWFIHRAFIEAQEHSEIGSDEVFDYWSILSPHDRGKLAEFPYQLSLRSRDLLKRYCNEDVCEYPPERLWAQDQEGYMVAVTILSLCDDGAIVGAGRCRSFLFGGVSSFDVCQELALIDVAERLEQYLHGHILCSPPAEVNVWRERILEWNKRAHRPSQE
jgi:hypothetical protein